MKKAFLPALLLVVVGFLVWRTIQADERAAQEKAAYDKTIDSIAVQLAGAKAKVDTLVDTVKVQRVRIVERAAKVDTVKLAFQRDTTTSDSLHTALIVIASQDSLIVEQAGHIKTLNEVIAADSGVARLFIAQRNTDSLRIAQLERPKGFRIPWLDVPVKCGPAVSTGVTATGKIAVTVGVACVL